MKLYHYTSLNNFLHIWRTKQLLFSSAHKVTNNDIYEKRKKIQITGDALSCNRENVKAFFDSLSDYHQISLNSDYDDGTLGCLSPMMWGQYADNANGVCLELDSKALVLAPLCLWFNKVSYVKEVPLVDIDAKLLMNSELHDSFIVNHINDLFFTKHCHWAMENEYRIISKKIPFLDISNSLVKIHVPTPKGHTTYVVREMVGDRCPISCIITTTNNNGLCLRSEAF